MLFWHGDRLCSNVINGIDTREFKGLKTFMSHSLHIHNSIAEQMATYLNEAVDQLLDDGMQAIGSSTQLPLIKLLEVVQSRYTHSASLLLKRRYPWISATDVSLGCCIEPRDMGAVERQLDRLNLSLDAVAGLCMTAPRTSKGPAVFESVVKALDPYALHQLEKYVQWQNKECGESLGETKAKLAAIEARWASLCHDYGVELLEEASKGDSLPMSWKSLFVATYFRLHCLSLCYHSNEEQLPALVLFLDNRVMLERCGAMDLVS